MKINKQDLLFFLRSLPVEQVKKHFLLLLLLAIFFLGFIVRFYNVSSNPIGFFCDEASISYNAYTIATTGKDEFGSPFPVLFRSFGNFRPGVSIYFSTPFVILLGLNELSSRLPSVVIGTATIILIYFLAKTLFSSRIIGIVSALFLAISPWHIHFSRIGQENIYFPFFLTLSTLFICKGIKERKKYLLIISFALFGITLYTYVPAYFLTPLFLFSILLLYKNNLWAYKKELAIGIIIFFILSIPLVNGLRTGETLARFHDASSVNKGRSNQEIISKAIITYKDHFLPEFLFQKGDIGYHTHFITRFSVRGMGQLYWFQLPFIVVSLIFLIKHKTNFFIFLFLLLLYPLGSTAIPFTDGGGPFATRSIIGVIPFQILSAVGVIVLLRCIKNRVLNIIAIFVLLILITFSFKTYLHHYFDEYPLYSSDFWGWQHGAGDIVQYFVKHENQYDDLIMAPEFNAPEIFFKFYAPDNCLKCKIGSPENLYNSERRQLFAVSNSYLLIHPNFKFKTIQLINYPNGNVAFRLGEIIQ